MKATKYTQAQNLAYRLADIRARIDNLNYDLVPELVTIQTVAEGATVDRDKERAAQEAIDNAVTEIKSRIVEANTRSKVEQMTEWKNEAEPFVAYLRDTWGYTAYRLAIPKGTEEDSEYKLFASTQSVKVKEFVKFCSGTSKEFVRKGDWYSYGVVFGRHIAELAREKTEAKVVYRAGKGKEKHLPNAACDILAAVSKNKVSKESVRNDLQQVVDAMFFKPAEGSPEKNIAMAQDKDVRMARNLVLNASKRGEIIEQEGDELWMQNILIVLNRIINLVPYEVTQHYLNSRK